MLNKYLNFTESKKLNSRNLLTKNIPGIKPYWLILKCTKCHKKSIPIFFNDLIKPVSKYCRHCGTDKFYLEKKQNIERLDTIYALYSKDISNVNKEMVSIPPTSPECKLSEVYVSQKISKAWSKEKMNLLDNVIQIDRRLIKGT